MTSRPLIDADGIVRNVIKLDDGVPYTPPDGLTLGPAGGILWGRWNGSNYVLPTAFLGQFMTNASGRIQVSPEIIQGKRTAVFIAAGQSLICNHGITRYIPHNIKVENGNIYDGYLYRMVDPVLGPTGTDGSFLGRLGDKLIDGGLVDRVIIWPIGVTATSSGDWAANGSDFFSVNLPGRLCRGWVHERLRLVVNRIQALGLMPYVCGVLWQQGQADAYFGTDPSLYGPNIRDMIHKTRSYGLRNSVPWFIAQDTMILGTIYPAYRAAQAAVVNLAQNILAGPNIDYIPATIEYRYDGGTHLSDAGNDLCATLWLQAIKSANILSFL